MEEEKIPIQTDRELKEGPPPWANETFWQFLKRTVPRDWPYIKEVLKEQAIYSGITAVIASFLSTMLLLWLFQFFHDIF